MLQRHTAVISTLNENVAGNAMLPYETPAETQQALETGYGIEMRVIGPHHDRVRAQSRCDCLDVSCVYEYDV